VLSLVNETCGTVACRRPWAVNRGAVLVLALALVGCASQVADEETTAQSTPTPVATVSPASEPSTPIGAPEQSGDEEAVEGYMKGLASGRPDIARDALQYAAADSVAHIYLQHQANLFEAGLDGGMYQDESSVDGIDGGYEMCDVIDVCNEFTDFRTEDGFVADLRVNGQDPGPRLAVGDGSAVESRGVTATLLSAYLSIASESLFVAVEISTSDADAEMYLYSATYRAPDGRQRQAADVLGPFEISAESTATVAMAFPAAEPGGTITIEGIADDDYSRTIEFVVPVG
jgi:hypothetical protein